MPTSKRRTLTAAFPAALIGVLAVLFAPSVMAKTVPPPPPLSGEVLAASGESVHVTCVGTVDAFTISYTASGIASGPYPGTFTESGRHFGPGVDIIEASFTIVSGSTTITGTKVFVPDAPGSTTACGSSVGPGTTALLQYEATIRRGGKEFRDRGTADTQFLSFLPSDPAQSIPTFREAFTSALTEPIRVYPGKGCGDENHEHEREGDC